MVMIEDEHLEFSKKELWQAEEILLWIEISLQLSLKIAFAHETILSNKLFRLNDTISNLGTLSVEEIFMTLPAYISKAFLCDHSYVIRYSKEQMHCYSLQQGGSTKCFSQNIDKHGLYYDCAKEARPATYLKTAHSETRMLNLWAYDIFLESVKGLFEPNETALFYLEPVYYISKVDKTTRRSTRRLSGCDSIHPITTEFITKDKQRQVIAVLVVVHMRSKRKPHGFELMNRQKLARAAAAISTSIRLSQLHYEMLRKLQHLDLASEIMDYHCAPTSAEIHETVERYNRSRLLFSSYRKRLQDISHLGLRFDTPRRITMALFMLREGTGFTIPIEALAYFIHSIKKRCFKRNPYTNDLHAYHALQGSYVVFLQFGFCFQQLELTALMIACSSLSLGHRGITDAGHGPINLSTCLNRNTEDSPVENFNFEIIMKIITEENGLIVNMKESDKHSVLQNLGSLMIMCDSRNIHQYRRKYSTLPETMDWDNSEHRISVLEMFAYLCMREYLYKNPDETLDILINSIMVEYTNKGHDELANDHPVHPLMDASRWQQWPAMWLEVFEYDALFVASTLTKILPRASIFEDAIRLNIKNLKVNRVGVLEQIKASLDTFLKPGSAKQLPNKEKGTKKNE